MDRLGAGVRALSDPDGTMSGTSERGADVSEIVSPQVQLIGWTQFQPPAGVPWSTDADGGQALAEFAGRACYQSWNKPNQIGRAYV